MLVPRREQEWNCRCWTRSSFCWKTATKASQRAQSHKKVEHNPIRKYMYVYACGQALHADCQPHLSLENSFKPSGYHKFHNRRDAVAFPCSSRAWGHPVCHCSGRENGKSRNHPSGRLHVAAAPVGNNSYASQTHNAGHSYEHQSNRQRAAYQAALPHTNTWSLEAQPVFY